MCAVLFIVGASLFTYQISKPDPLTIDNVNISNNNPTAKGLPVDLDNLIVHWVARGEPEELTIFLENMDTKERSRVLSIRSDTGSIEFMKKDYSS